MQPHSSIKKSIGKLFNRKPAHPEQRDDKTRLAPNEPAAPPNSPREKPPATPLFGTPRPSRSPQARRHRRSHTALHSSSEDQARTQDFFREKTTAHKNTVARIAQRPLNTQEDDRTSLRDSLLELEVGLEMDAECNAAGHGPIVSLGPTPTKPEKHVATGLPLKQAAAAVDPAQPLQTVVALNAWLASGPCKGEPLRLKTPGKGEPFMSRSRFSNKDSLLFDHEADHDVPEQIAAFEHLQRLAGWRSPEMPRALHEALATLENYLDALPQGKSAHAVKDPQRHNRVKDTPALRRLLQAVETAVLASPPTVSTFGRDNDPQANSATSSGDSQVWQATEATLPQPTPWAAADPASAQAVTQLLKGRPIAPFVLPPDIARQMSDIIESSRRRSPNDQQPVELIDEGTRTRSSSDQ